MFSRAHVSIRKSPRSEEPTVPTAGFTITPFTKKLRAIFATRFLFPTKSFSASFSRRRMVCSVTSISRGNCSVAVAGMPARERPPSERATVCTFRGATSGLFSSLRIMSFTAVDTSRMFCTRPWRTLFTAGRVSTARMCSPPPGSAQATAPFILDDAISMATMVLASICVGLIWRVGRYR